LFAARVEDGRERERYDVYLWEQLDAGNFGDTLDEDVGGWIRTDGEGGERV